MHTRCVDLHTQEVASGYEFQVQCLQSCNMVAGDGEYAKHQVRLALNMEGISNNNHISIFLQ